MESSPARRPTKYVLLNSNFPQSEPLVRESAKKTSRSTRFDVICQQRTDFISHTLHLSRTLFFSTNAKRARDNLLLFWFTEAKTKSFSVEESRWKSSPSRAKFLKAITSTTRQQLLHTNQVNTFRPYSCCEYLSSNTGSPSHKSKQSQ